MLIFTVRYQGKEYSFATQKEREAFLSTLPQTKGETIELGYDRVR